MNYNIMRMICMFDLPVETAKERKNYRKFRKKLILEGWKNGCRVLYRRMEMCVSWS